MGFFGFIRNVITISLSLCYIFIPSTYASVPFSPNEITTIKQNLFKNIATKTNTFTKNDHGLLIYSIPGAVLASPSKYEAGFSQDYQFHWVRDAAITMQEIAYLYSQATTPEKNKLKVYLLNYLAFEEKAQRGISKAGEKTLGQPKYNLDGSIWEGTWTRPQNDSPAMRAIAMMNIIQILSAEHASPKLIQRYLAVSERDLNYLVAEWQNPTYDLWEEVQDNSHFFTLMVQRKALIEGSHLFKQFGKINEATQFSQQAKAMTIALKQHWQSKPGYYAETTHHLTFKGGNLDTSILLGVLYGNLNKPDDAFALTDDRIISSIYVTSHAFKQIYPLNRNQSVDLLGRYPSDQYDGNQFLGGNPWVLTSIALAEYDYDLANLLHQRPSITITPLNYAFFKQFYPNLTERTHQLKDGDEGYRMIIQGLVKQGDIILWQVKQYANCYTKQSCLHLAEQIDRNNGAPTSAKDLSWNYSLLLSALQARPRTII